MSDAEWSITDAVDAFLAQAGEFLLAERARNTVLLTVTETLRVNAATSACAPGGEAALSHGSSRSDEAALSHGSSRSDEAAPSGGAAPSDGPALYGGIPLYGWWRPAPTGQARPELPAAAFLHTPPFPVLLTDMTDEAAAALAHELGAAGHEVPGVNAPEHAAWAFAKTWRQRTGTEVSAQRQMRLFRLAQLSWPSPMPEGKARLATAADRDLLISWFGAFSRDVGEAYVHDQGTAVDERLSYRGLTIWESGGIPVSLASVTRAVAGMVRVGPVYTPPELRGRGYAGAVTATVSHAAADAGAAEVLLYTDLANPTSNALYQRLGYRPVEDRVMLAFG
jgi:GNAT superfamily N-acetyltransferase